MAVKFTVPSTPESNFNVNTPTPTPSTLDRILTRQILVAWAGERGEEPRLGWWRTDLISEFGGADLLKQILPTTWAWAILQAVREAARRADTARRSQGHDPDRLVTLYSLGFALDERLDERLLDLKRTGRPPTEVLPGLKALLPEDWSQDDALDLEWDPAPFTAWVAEHGSVQPITEPVGRRLKGAAPADPEQLTAQLTAALLPLADAYPMPHFRRSA